MSLFWIKNNRYYKIIFQPTLFGTIDIICSWGRIGGNLGNYKVVSSKDKQDIELIIDTIKKRRRQRGYKLCS
ncbi:MAG: WGR domain-containing protein [Paraclostridium sp.]